MAKSVALNEGGVDGVFGDSVMHSIVIRERVSLCSVCLFAPICCDRADVEHGKAARSRINSAPLIHQMITSAVLCVYHFVSHPPPPICPVHIS